MLYVVKLLDNVYNINAFNIVDEMTITRSNPQNLYFMLMVKTQDRSGTDLYIRYIPQGTVNIVETYMDNIDSDHILNRVAVQAFSDDKSIYYMPLLSTDGPCMGAMRVVLYEDGVARNFEVQTDLAVNEQGDRSRFT